jgi:hypothetical protein
MMSHNAYIATKALMYTREYIFNFDSAMTYMLSLRLVIGNSTARNMKLWGYAAYLNKSEVGKFPLSI